MAFAWNSRTKLVRAMIMNIQVSLVSTYVLADSLHHKQHRLIISASDTTNPGDADGSREGIHDGTNTLGIEGKVCNPLSMSWMSANSSGAGTMKKFNVSATNSNHEEVTHVQRVLVARLRMLLHGLRILATAQAIFSVA